MSYHSNPPENIPEWEPTRTGHWPKFKLDRDLWLRAGAYRSKTARCCNAGWGTWILKLASSMRLKSLRRMAPGGCVWDTCGAG
jgi:hypothetical protein